jgi:hypothetical protein
MDASAVAKIIVGLILVIVGAWLLFPLPLPPIAGIEWGAFWENFIFLLKAIIPPFLIVLGLVLMWIESEDVKYSNPRKK